jgi:hypothetical protein
LFYYYSESNHSTIKLKDGRKLDFEVAKTNLLNALQKNKELFLNSLTSSSTDDDYDDDYDNHESSYEKYGGYNGYDDDTIDDAFEGDPENTWNVD